MERLTLVPPSLEYGDEVMAYRAEMLANGDSLDGCAGLEDVSSCEEWLDFEGRLRTKFGAGYSPSQVFLAVRPSDNRLVGIADYRPVLTEFLRQYGGNIGYSVRPSERRRGYAGQLLGLVLERCWEQGADQVLVTCDKANEPSARVIRAHGGVLEDEVEDRPGLGQSGTIQRYWISLWV